MRTVRSTLQRWNIRFLLKLNCRKKVLYFALNFLPWEFLLIKKLDFEKTKTTQYTTFKIDIIKKVLDFLISKFLLTKISREGNRVRFRCSNSALDWSGQKSSVVALTKYPIHKFKPVQQRIQHALRAYCSNLFFAENVVKQKDVLLFPYSARK